MELGYGPNQSVWKLATKIIPTQENYLRNMTPSFRWKSLSKNESYFFFPKAVLMTLINAWVHIFLIKGLNVEVESSSFT